MDAVQCMKQAPELAVVSRELFETRVADSTRDDHWIYFSFLGCLHHFPLPVLPDDATTAMLSQTERKAEEKDNAER